MSEERELRALINAIHDKLEYGDVFQWDDGDPCWEQMRKVAAGFDLSPPGYVLVLAEPSEAMIDAGTSALKAKLNPCDDVFSKSIAESIYRAMLTAAQDSKEEG